MRSGGWDDELYSGLSRLTSCAHITSQALKLALTGYSLPIKFDDRWLAAACRHAYFSTVNKAYEHYPGQQAVRQELLNLCKSLGDVREKLGARSDWAESVLRRATAFDEMENPSDEVIDDTGRLAFLADWREGGNELMRQSSDTWRQFDDACRAIANVENFIADATDRLCFRTDPPRWKDAERRKERISLAVCMSAVFEMAFDKLATINSWDGPDGKPKLGAWPDFYRRIAPLLLQERRIPDLQGVLKAARKSYREAPWVNLPSNFPPQMHP